MTASQSRSITLSRCNRALKELKAGARRWSLWVPGRIEVLGKHTDYAGGRSVLCALERGFLARVAPRRDGVIRVVNVTAGATFETSLTPTASGEPGLWTHYVATVARRLSRDLPRLRFGVDIAFVSDLPVASGMSSSSALLIMTYMAVARANGIERRMDFKRVVQPGDSLAAFLGAVENGRPFGPWRGDAGVGTLGGNQDQIAIMRSEPGQLVRYGWSPVRNEGTMKVPQGYVFALASSGVGAAKSAEAMPRYNRISSAIQRLNSEWNTRTGRRAAMLFDALISGPDAEGALRAIAGTSRDATFTAPVLTARLEQFIEETLEIIPAAWDALERGSMAEFGLLVDRSQYLAEAKLGNQIPETVSLQRQARVLGAVASSAFGAGFGGSVWALVPEKTAGAFLGKWRAEYAEAFPRHASNAEFFLSKAGAPAAWL